MQVGMYTMRAARCQWARAYSAVEGGAENAYKILGLQRDCSAENVRAAFRELAKATHPDTQQGRAASGAHFVRVLAAYQIPGNERFMMLSWESRRRISEGWRSFTRGRTTIGRRIPSRGGEVQWIRVRAMEGLQTASTRLRGRSLCVRRPKWLSG